MPNTKWQYVMKYDSKWEKHLHTGVLKKWEFHPEPKISYIISKTYEVDYMKVVAGKTYYLEAKGRFRDSREAAKYVWIRKTLDPKTEELIFIFYNPNKPMPNAKRRKDGTKHTHAEWADKHGFRWFTEETLSDRLLKKH